MGWNEPDNQRPKKSNEEGPPDLDEALKKLQQKLARIFGGKQKPGSSPDSGSGAIALSLVLLLAIFMWAIAGVFVVGPANRAVVLRFGQYHETLGPGLHWIPRFIESKDIVNVEKVKFFKYSDAMINKDENLVSATVSVQYRVIDSQQYLFNVNEPEESLKQATASAFRQVIGHTGFDELLTTGRVQVGKEVTELLEKIIEPYNTGLMIMGVSLQEIRPPVEVSEAFADAIKAQEDEKTYVREAQAYVSNVIPQARGEVSRIKQEATAYKEQVILRAKGDVARFERLLPEYQHAPQVTRQRLYIDTMSDIYAQTSKIFIDSPSNNLMYLPLDKLITGAESKAPTQTSDLTHSNRLQIPPVVTPENERWDTRGRESYPGRGE